MGLLVFLTSLGKACCRRLHEERPFICHSSLSHYGRQYSTSTTTTTTTTSHSCKQMGCFHVSTNPLATFLLKIKKTIITTTSNSCKQMGCLHVLTNPPVSYTLMHTNS